MDRKILVVEDNDKNRRLIGDVLKYYGYDVIEAVNGDEGINMTREYKPDLILMDMQMPVMDGFTAMKILKNDPTTKHIRIIAITSFAMTGDKERIMSAGADDYISKPVNTMELPMRIEKLLGKE
jgi:CheY-like chemotaxis protein